MQTILEPQSFAGTSLQELMREMLVRLGEDPERDGLRGTPERMERSMQYLTKGYQENPQEILRCTMFDVDYTFCRFSARFAGAGAPHDTD